MAALSVTANPFPRRSQSLEVRISECYAQLAKSERAVADVILSFPGDVAGYSATELAALAGASKAAASRLFKRLGYSGFDEVRRVARDARDQGSPWFLHSATTEMRPLAEAVASHAVCEAENIRATFANFPDDLDPIIEALTRAPRVACIGFRTSRMVADYLRWSLLQVRCDVRIVPPPGETLAEYVSDLDRTDLAVVVGLRRRTMAVRTILDALGKRGVRTLLLGDSTSLAVGQLATWRLTCETRGSGPLVSDAAAFSLASFLASRVAVRLAQTAHERMRAVENMHHVLGELE